MTSPDVTFHHYGLGVREPEEASRFLAQLGYGIGEAVFDPLQKVNLSLCTHSIMPTVEIVWPGHEKSPIDRIIKDGPSIYHTCYATCHGAAWVLGLERGGADILTVSPPTPAVLFGGKKVSFHIVSGVGLIEILHLED